MAKKHEEFVENFFSESEDAIMLSSELNKLIIEEFPECSKTNARKIINSCLKNNKIKSTKPFFIEGRQYAYFNKKLEKEKVLAKFKKSNSSIVRIFNRIGENGGIISEQEIKKIGATPLGETSTNVKSFDQVIESLIKESRMKKMNIRTVNFLRQTELESENEYVNDGFRLLQEMEVNTSFILPIMKYLVNINLIDNREIYRYTPQNNLNNIPIINELSFDGYAYSYTTGFYPYISHRDFEKSTLVVLDINVVTEYNINDLRGFYDRIQIYRNSTLKNKRNIIPIICFNKIENEAYFQARYLNIIMLDINTIFGDNISELIDSLMFIHKNKYSQISYHDKELLLDNSKTALEFINNGGHKLSFGNMKGDIFELLMVELIQRVYGVIDVIYRENIKHECENLETKELLKFEYDLIVQTKKEFIVFEFKAYKESKEIELGYIDFSKGYFHKNSSLKWFFERDLYGIKDKYSNLIKEENLDLKMCYITTSQIEDKQQTLDYVQRTNRSKHKPSKLLSIYSRNELFELLREDEVNDYRDRKFEDLENVISLYY